MKKITLILLLSACANAQAELPTVVDNSSYPASSQAPFNTASAASSSAMYELMARLEQMQTEVQQLTGKVDEQAFAIEELKKRQSKLYSDFDERLQGVENKGGVAPQANTGAVPEATNEAAPAATGSGQATTEVAPVPVVVSTDKAASTSQTPPVETVTPPSAPKPTTEVSTPEKEEYALAYNELRIGHTQQSVDLFRAYLAKYPSGLYANNAQYWLAEAYRVQKDNNAAYQAFTDVIEKYPNGAKVPDALLRLGMIEADKNNIAKAREYFTRIGSEFPKSQVAQIAQKKLLKLDEVKN